MSSLVPNSAHPCDEEDRYACFFLSRNQFVVPSRDLCKVVGPGMNLIPTTYIRLIEGYT